MSDACDTAKTFIASAESFTNEIEYYRASASALTGIGFALIAIAEALERQQPPQGQGQPPQVHGGAAPHEQEADR